MESPLSLSPADIEKAKPAEEKARRGKWEQVEQISKMVAQFAAALGVVGGLLSAITVTMVSAYTLGVQDAMQVPVRRFMDLPVSVFEYLGKIYLIFAHINFLAILISITIGTTAGLVVSWLVVKLIEGFTRNEVGIFVLLSVMLISGFLIMPASGGRLENLAAVSGTALIFYRIHKFIRDQSISQNLSKPKDLFRSLRQYYDFYTDKAKTLKPPPAFHIYSVFIFLCLIILSVLFLYRKVYLWLCDWSENKIIAIGLAAFSSLLIAALMGLIVLFLIGIILLLLQKVTHHKPWVQQTILWLQKSLVTFWFALVYPGIIIRSVFAAYRWLENGLARIASKISLPLAILFGAIWLVNLFTGSIEVVTYYSNVIGWRQGTQAVCSSPQVLFSSEKTISISSDQNVFLLLRTDKEYYVFTTTVTSTLPPPPANIKSLADPLIKKSPPFTTGCSPANIIILPAPSVGEVTLVYDEQTKPGPCCQSMPLDP